MKYVVDASVAFKWAVNEPLADKARLLRDDYRNGFHELLAPDIFPAEIGNAILIAERRGIVPSSQGSTLLADVMTTIPQLHVALPNLLPRASAIASKFGRTVYDCLYVALAEREQCDMITADDKLINSLQLHFNFIKHLNTLP